MSKNEDALKCLNKALSIFESHRAAESEKETEKFRLKNEELAKLNAEIKSQKEETEKGINMV